MRAPVSALSEAFVLSEGFVLSEAFVLSEHVTDPASRVDPNAPGER